MTDFTGMGVLVTGAASGIGRASALAFVAAGARVAAADVDGPGLAVLADGSGGRIVPITADVRDPDQVEVMVATAVDALGRLDVAHKNAGVPGPYRPFCYTAR
jgi:NAD(P)-dependent dehydrogenase (short-subunit alcohol dehydrogenase family)